MRIAIVAHDSLPLPAEPATSAGLRVWNLALALRARAGNEIVLAAPPTPGAAPIPWVHRVPPADLGAWLRDQRAVAIVLSDWKQVAALAPRDGPVALDIARWPLEASPTGNAAVDQWRAFAAALARADFISVATDTLRDALRPFLAAAGALDRAVVVPFAMAPDLPTPAPERNGRRVLLFGNGADAAAIAEGARLVAEFTQSITDTGITVVGVHGTAAPKASGLPKNVDAVVEPSFAELLALLRASDLALVLPAPGVEVAAEPAVWATLCLWAGVPLISCDDRASLRAVVSAKAGWLIHDADPAAQRKTIAKAVASPAELAKRAAAAQTHARAHLTWTDSIEPLAAWCAAPVRGASKVSFANASPVPSTPTLQHGESRETPLGRITLHLDPPLPPAHPHPHGVTTNHPPAKANGGRPLTIPAEAGERVLSPMAVLVALPAGVLLLGFFLLLEILRSVVAPPDADHARRS